MAISNLKCALLFGWAILVSSLSVGQMSADSVLLQANSIEPLKARIYFLDSVCGVWGRELRPSGALVFEELLRAYAKSGSEDELMRKVASFSRYHLNRGDFEKAKAIWIRYEDWVNSTEDIFQKRTYHYELSYVEERMENIDAALAEINRAIHYSEQLADSTYIIFGEVYKAKGRILQGLSRFADAVVELNKARSVFIAANDSVGVAQTMMQLGIVYGMIGLYDESEKYIEERYAYMPNAPEISRIMDAVNLGRNDLTQNRYEQAYQRFLQYYQNGEIPKENIWVYPYLINGCIESMYFTNRYEEIPQLYTHLVDSFSFLRAEEGIAFLFDQSQFFNDLIQEKYESAEQLALKLYKGSLAKNDATEAMLHMRFLVEAYKRMNKHVEALHYAEMLAIATDSSRTANKTNALLLYQTQYETKEKEYEIVRLGNEKKIEQTRAQFFLAIVGGLIGLILIGGILYSKLRKLKNKLSEQNEELAVLNKTKNKFFRIIGHDLRNPIISFKALRNRIERQRKKQDQEGVSESLALIGKSTDQVTNLLDNLMEWVLGQDGLMPCEPETISVKDILNTNVELYRELASEKEISLRLNVSEDLGVWADKNALNGVCRNLISNAIKFTNRGGEVRVEATSAAKGVAISFADNGIGMNEEEQQGLFQVGSKSAKGTAGESGSGLGLALVKELVELNKGNVSVKSTPGKGTTFTVII